MNILSIGISFFQLPLLLSWLQLPTSQQLDQMRYPQQQHPSIPVPLPMYLHNNNNNNNNPFQPLKRFSPSPFNFHNIFSNIKHFFNNPQQQQQQFMSPRLMQLLSNPQNQVVLENFFRQQTNMASNNVAQYPQSRRNQDGPAVFTTPNKMGPEMMNALMKMADAKRKSQLVEPRPHLALQLIKDVALPNMATTERQLGRQTDRKEQMELFEMLAKHYRMKDEEEKEKARAYSLVEPRTIGPVEDAAVSSSLDAYGANSEKLKAVLNDKTNELLKLKKLGEESRASSSLASMMADNRPEEISLIRKLLLKLDQHELNMVGKLIHVVINKPAFLPRILQENLSDDVKHVLQVIQVLKFPQTLVGQIQTVKTPTTTTTTTTTAIPIQKKSWKESKTSDKSLIPLVYWLDDKNQRMSSSGGQIRHENRFESVRGGENVHQSGGSEYVHGRVDQRRLSPNYRPITEKENYYSSPRVSPSYSSHTSLKATESKPSMYKISLDKQSLPEPSIGDSEIPDRYRKVLQDVEPGRDGKWQNSFQSTDWRPMKNGNGNGNNYHSHPVAYFQTERGALEDEPSGFREGKRLRFKADDVQSEESGLDGTYLGVHSRKTVENSWERGKERGNEAYGRKIAKKRLKNRIRMENSGENSWENHRGWWNGSLVPCLTTTDNIMSSEDKEMYETSASISSVLVVTPYGTTKWEENYGNDISIRPENKVNRFTTEVAPVEFATVRPVAAATINTKTNRNPVSSTTMGPKTTRNPVSSTTMGLETNRNPISSTTMEPVTTMKLETNRNPVSSTTMEPVATTDRETNRNPVLVTTMEPKTDRNPVQLTTVEPKTTKIPVKTKKPKPESVAENQFELLNDKDIIPIVSPFPVYIPEGTTEKSIETNQFILLDKAEETTSAHVLVSLESDVGNNATRNKLDQLQDGFNNGRVFSTVNNPHSEIAMSNKAEEMELMQHYFPAGYWPKVLTTPPASTMAKNNPKRKIKLRWFDTEDNNRHNQSR